MTTCKRPGCDAPLAFVRMASSGKAMPVDPHPDDRGNIAAAKGSRGWVNGHYLAKGQEPAENEVRLMPHWSTCSDPQITGRPQRRSRPKRPAATRLPYVPLVPVADPAPPLFEIETPSSDPPAPF